MAIKSNKFTENIKESVNSETLLLPKVEFVRKKVLNRDFLPFNSSLQGHCSGKLHCLNFKRSLLHFVDFEGISSIDQIWH